MSHHYFLSAMPTDVPEAMLACADKAVKVAPIYATRWYWRTEFEPGQFVFFVADEDVSREELAVVIYETTLTLNCNVAASQMAKGTQAELEQQRMQ